MCDDHRLYFAQAYVIPWCLVGGSYTVYIPHYLLFSGSRTGKESMGVAAASTFFVRIEMFKAGSMLF